jgi:hypothetical protein
MTALLAYLHTAHAPTLAERIWQRIRTAISGPAPDLARAAA